MNREYPLDKFAVLFNRFLVPARLGARPMRMLLAEALAQAGRHQEAVEQYRKLV